jgi:hypothetical protein
MSAALDELPGSRGLDRYGPLWLRPYGAVGAASSIHAVRG